MKKISFIIFLSFIVVLGHVDAMDPQPGEAEETKSTKSSPLKKAPLLASLVLDSLTLEQGEDTGPLGQVYPPLVSFYVAFLDQGRPASLLRFPFGHKGVCHGLTKICMEVICGLS